MVLAIFLGIPPAPRNLGLGSGQQPSGEVRAAYAQLHRALADLGALARLQRQTECRLEQPYHEAALHLALAADMRMGGRGERLVRVGQFAACLGTAIGLKQDTVALLCRAAALQNVGFAAQAAPHPAARLAPPRTQGRCHTLLGAEVLAGCDHPLFALGQTIALAHHERWDGQGYPLGLCGRHIPLAAQIAAMADTPESALRPPFRRSGARGWQSNSRRMQAISTRACPGFAPWPQRNFWHLANVSAGALLTPAPLPQMVPISIYPLESPVDVKEFTRSPGGGLL